jgi:hypothetical protein
LTDGTVFGQPASSVAPFAANEFLGSPLALRELGRPGIDPRGIEHALTDKQLNFAYL